MVDYRRVNRGPLVSEDVENRDYDGAPVRFRWVEPSSDVSELNFGFPMGIR